MTCRSYKRPAQPSFPPVRVGRIKYMNSDPVYYHLERHPKSEILSLYPGTPARLNRLMQTGALDISPVSSVEYGRNHQEYLILPGLSVSSNGPVGSVFLMSRVPRRRLADQPLWVTEESETSRELLKLLMKTQTPSPPRYVPKRICEEELDREKPHAALLIGDTALRGIASLHGFPYRYDLAEWWKQETGLGFVFALWVVRRNFASMHPNRVRAAHEALLESRHRSRGAILQMAASAESRLRINRDLLRTYLENLEFDLSPALLQGLGAFFEKLREENILPAPVPLKFFADSEMAFLDCMRRITPSNEHARTHAPR